jgi:hypothetical protein
MQEYADAHEVPGYREVSRLKGQLATRNPFGGRWATASACFCSSIQGKLAGPGRGRALAYISQGPLNKKTIRNLERA